jgi:hypothetical protein
MKGMSAMAQKTIVTLVDDLTGEEAQDISTVEFSLDGVLYQLDLTDTNRDTLRGALSPYIAAGRKIGGRRRGPRRPRPVIKNNGRASGYTRETSKAIRAWAKTHGYTVSDRGRISLEVMQAWQRHAGKSV